MKLKTFESVTLYRFRYWIGYGLIIGFGLFLLLFRLGHLVPGLAEPEVASIKTSNLHAIVDNPINAPYRVLQLGFHKVFSHQLWAVRFPSVLFALLFIVGVYLFLRYAYTERVAVMGAMLAGISTTLARFGRIGVPAIATAASLAALLGLGAWVMTAEVIRRHHLLVLAAVAILACYTPLGFVWLILLIALHPQELRRTISDASNLWLGIAGFLLLLALAPIIYAGARHPHILSAWILWPDHLPSLGSFAQNLLRIPAAFFWRHTFSDPVTHLSNLPLLDIFTSAMVVLGALTLAYKPKLARTRILLFAGLIGLGVNALNPAPVNNALLLPVVAILAAVGLERMLEEWYSMFPRNPFARVGALIPLALIFSLTFFYHMHRSFLAWPKNPDTKAYFQQQLP